ncbi:MAG: metal-dependent hydrolase, partial [Proteobacteria bacterium]|nr:metal-dependent hydrolase [Pseudomonadota bacterium]
MSDITVRKVDFEFSEDTPLYALPGMPRVSLFIAAFSLTMPYLEPYLIRMFLKAQQEVTDPALLEDMKRFSQQEGNHYRNHARINEIIRSKFDDETAAELLRIEQELKADYERFLKTRSLKFNLAYAEGFEAMTCAVAISAVNRDEQKEPPLTGLGGLLAWHALEEVEHRTVAFDVYKHLCGGYFYRIFGALRAQVHYLYAIHKFYRVMLKAQGLRMYPYVPYFILAGHYRYLNSFMP